MLTIVESALRAKGRLPATRTNLHRHNVTGFHLETQPGGWAATITFEDGPASTPSSLGNPETVYPSKQEAFMAGAKTVCHLLTGSKKLPFSVAGRELVVSGYGTGGFPGIFLMKMPAPWI